MSNETTHHEYIIIGAGPAGVQLGYYMQKSGWDYLILEGGDVPGHFFGTYPRHGKLISINKVYTGYDDPEINMRWDWNSLLSDDFGVLFKDYTKEYFPQSEDFLRYIADYVERYGIQIRYGTSVVHVRKDEEKFTLTAEDGAVFTCDRLVMATGTSKPYIPENIPGIELAEQYADMSVDLDDYLGQRVLVIGKGNSGFETADHLVGVTSLIHVLSPHPVKLAWKTHYVGHLRAVNNNFLDTYQLKSQNALLDAVIRKIEKVGDEYHVSVSYSHAQGEEEILKYDRILCCTGWRFDDSIFDESCHPTMTIQDRFPAQTSWWESTNVPGLFFTGTINQQRDFKKSTSGFIHGFRYNTKSLYRLLAARFHDKPLPRRRIEATTRGIFEAISKRINRTSALWQQFGFFGDAVIIAPDRSYAEYFEELPVAYIHDTLLGQQSNYYVITFEFGKHEGDPFDVQRSPTPDRADESFFLHPVIRHFAGPSQVSEFHLLEDLFAEWTNPEQHEKPLLEYLRHEVAQGAPDVTTASGRIALPDSDQGLKRIPPMTKSGEAAGG